MVGQHQDMTHIIESVVMNMQELVKGNMELKAP